MRSVKKSSIFLFVTVATAIFLIYPVNFWKNFVIQTPEFSKFFRAQEIMQGLSPNDPSSFARPDLVTAKSLHLSLNVNFKRQTLSGFVTSKFKKTIPASNELILDIKDLTIFYIYNSETGKNLEYKIGETVNDIGTELKIDVTDCSENFEVVIGYETSPTASGLQWLTPQQTAGKIHPFLFSQGQPTEMRSIVPCQDTPSAKIPYSADIRAPKELTVLMSALRVGTPVDLPDDTRLHLLNQPVPMATYLIAIAVGALESRKLSERSQVWSEKELVDKAAYEFSETEQMLQIAESICGPYVWGIYDVLVLPPSFPYGGMENPCLTFVTPTLLAGDRSLADVIAHEITHSWTGNLVTNADFEHFWLNEGFTTFVERKIVGRMHGDKIRDFITLVGYDELRDTINVLGENNPYTKLVVDLRGVHPDEAFSRVPYEKGSLFLRYLEECVGGAGKFEEFLKEYIKKYEYKSIKTADFKNFFESYFKNPEILNKIDWDTWLHSPGLPKQIPNLDRFNVDQVQSAAEKWRSFDTKKLARSALPESSSIDSYSTIELSQLLNQLIETKPPLSVETLKAMNELYQFDNKTNAEIKSRWLRLCLESGWSEKIPPALEFLSSVGRMKYLNPIYRALYNHNESIAVEHFNKNKDNYMMVAQKTITRIFNKKGVN